MAIITIAITVITATQITQHSHLHIANLTLDLNPISVIKVLTSMFNCCISVDLGTVGKMQHVKKKNGMVVIFDHVIRVTSDSTKS